MLSECQTQAKLKDCALDHCVVHRVPALPWVPEVSKQRCTMSTDRDPGQQGLCSAPDLLCTCICTWGSALIIRLHMKNSLSSFHRDLQFGPASFTFCLPGRLFSHFHFYAPMLYRILFLSWRQCDSHSSSAICILKLPHRPPLPGVLLFRWYSHGI